MPLSNKKKMNCPTTNRSVYIIGAPHRENLLAKEDCLVAGGAACPLTVPSGDSHLVPQPGLTSGS